MNLFDETSLDDFFGFPAYHNVDQDTETARVAFVFAAASLGSGVYFLERTATKVDAHFQIQRIKEEQKNTRILPMTSHDLDVSLDKNQHLLEEYKKVYNSIKWKEVAGCAACSLLCGGLTFSLI